LLLTANRAVQDDVQRHCGLRNLAARYIKQLDRKRVLNAIFGKNVLASAGMHAFLSTLDNGSRPEGTRAGRSGWNTSSKCEGRVFLHGRPTQFNAESDFNEQ
jgi:hypothetical protein